MIEKKLTAKSTSGLHLRPAGKLCQLAQEYECHIVIRFRNKEFNAKSLLGVLSACITGEDEFVLICDGKDEQEAVHALAAFFQNDIPK